MLIQLTERGPASRRSIVELDEVLKKSSTENEAEAVYVVSAPKLTASSTPSNLRP